MTISAWSHGAPRPGWCFRLSPPPPPRLKCLPAPHAMPPLTWRFWRSLAWTPRPLGVPSDALGIVWEAPPPRVALSRSPLLAFAPSRATRCPPPDLPHASHSREACDVLGPHWCFLSNGRSALRLGGFREPGSPLSVRSFWPGPTLLGWGSFLPPPLSFLFVSGLGSFGPVEFVLVTALVVVTGPSWGPSPDWVVPVLPSRVVIWFPLF